MKALGHIRSDAILKRQAGGKKIASVDRQHPITVVLAPISEGTFAQRPLAGEENDRSAPLPGNASLEGTEKK